MEIPLPAVVLRARNSVPWKKVSFSLEIKDWPWGAFTELFWAGKDPFGHITSFPGSVGQGTKLWRGRKGDVWHPKEPSW